MVHRVATGAPSVPIRVPPPPIISSCKQAELKDRITSTVALVSEAEMDNQQGAREVSESHQDDDEVVILEEKEVQLGNESQDGQEDYPESQQDENEVVILDEDESESEIVVRGILQQVFDDLDFALKAKVAEEVAASLPTPVPAMKPGSKPATKASSKEPTPAPVSKLYRMQLTGRRAFSANGEHDEHLWRAAALFALNKSSNAKRKKAFANQDQVYALEIDAVSYVANPVLEEAFLRQKAKFNEAGKPDDEILVFHGTRKHNVASICEKNFDHSKETLPLFWLPFPFFSFVAPVQVRLRPLLLRVRGRVLPAR